MDEKDAEEGATRLGGEKYKALGGTAQSERVAAEKRGAGAEGVAPSEGANARGCVVLLLAPFLRNLYSMEVTL
jgi:hypothetical protein